ncbi:MAG: Uma2 family endonuclease [Pirellulales bacterium]
MSTSAAGHLVLHGISWSAYTQLTDLFADQRLRHAYDEGTLEMMAPLKKHDQGKKLLARFVESLSLELSIPIQSIGSTTLKLADRSKGIEPDECYYIAHEAAVRDKSDYDSRRDPPPDLAIEVDITSASVDRLSVYAALGVPEIWRLNGEELSFLLLTSSLGTYEAVSHSRAFPFLPVSVVSEFLSKQGLIDETSIVRSFVEWVRRQAS